MARYDFSSTRLYVESDLSSDGRLVIEDGQANLLVNVLRLKPGDGLLVFNGRQGEWRARVEETKKRTVALRLVDQARAQESGPDLDLCFAPLKHARLDYLVQKAVEMGAARLRPIITRRTQVTRLNLERMRANAIEAAEQCGVLRVPVVEPEIAFDRMIASWPADRILVFCDESAEARDPVAALKAAPSLTKAALLIGPEGGFDEKERVQALGVPHGLRLSLGPRILRADTAAVAGMTLIQGVLGDWAGSSALDTISP